MREKLSRMKNPEGKSVPYILDEGHTEYMDSLVKNLEEEFGVAEASQEEKTTGDLPEGSE